MKTLIISFLILSSISFNSLAAGKCEAEQLKVQDSWRTDFYKKAYYNSTLAAAHGSDILDSSNETLKRYEKNEIDVSFIDDLENDVENYHQQINLASDLLAKYEMLVEKNLGQLKSCVQLKAPKCSTQLSDLSNHDSATNRIAGIYIRDAMNASHGLKTVTKGLNFFVSGRGHFPKATVIHTIGLAKVSEANHRDSIKAGPKSVFEREKLERQLTECLK